MSILSWTGDYSTGYSGYSSYSGTSSKVLSQSKMNRIARDFASSNSEQLKQMNTYIENNEYDQAVSIFNQLKSNAAALEDIYNVELTDDNCESIVSNAFQNKNGLCISDTLKSNTGSSAFTTGLAEGLPFIGWLFSGMTENEALAEFNGQKVSTKDQVTECIGAGVSGAVCGAGVSIVGAIATGAVIGSSFPVAGTIIGAVVGAVVGVAQCLTKNAHKS